MIFAPNFPSHSHAKQPEEFRLDKDGKRRLSQTRHQISPMQKFPISTPCLKPNSTCFRK